MKTEPRKRARSTDEAIGAQIKHLRTQGGYTMRQFAGLVRECTGAGWSHTALNHVENGKKPCKTNDLFAIADVLGVTVADLLAMPEEVDLGGKVVRADALAAGPSRMPEVEGMARYRDMTAHLTTARNALQQYAHAAEVVRHLVETSPGLEDAIKRELATGRGEVADALAETQAHDLEHAAMLRREGQRVERSPFTEPVDRFAVAANASPAMVAARDALYARPLRTDVWRHLNVEEAAR